MDSGPVALSARAWTASCCSIGASGSGLDGMDAMSHAGVHVAKRDGADGKLGSRSHGVKLPCKGIEGMKSVGVGACVMRSN